MKIGANFFLRLDVAVIPTVVIMDNVHEIKLLCMISLLSSLAAIARLNTLLAVIFERKHRLKMRNLTSIVEVAIIDSDELATF